MNAAAHTLHVGGASRLSRYTSIGEAHKQTLRPAPTSPRVRCPGIVTLAVGSATHSDSRSLDGLRALRTLRALRPMRVAARMPGMKVRRLGAGGRQLAVQALASLTQSRLRPQQQRPTSPPQLCHCTRLLQRPSLAAHTSPRSPAHTLLSCAARWSSTLCLPQSPRLATCCWCAACFTSSLASWRWTCLG